MTTTKPMAATIILDLLRANQLDELLDLIENNPQDVTAAWPHLPGQSCDRIWQICRHIRFSPRM